MAATVTTETATHAVTLPDGRRLAYAVYGDPLATAATVFYCHAGLDCHLSAKMLDEPARERGIRIVAPDRPGVGRSTRKKNRTILDWPGDLLCLADAPAIEAKTFGVVAFGPGAAYALACCAKIGPDRLKAATILSGRYPFELRPPYQSNDMQFIRWVFTWTPFIMRWMMRSDYRARALDTEHPERFADKCRAAKKARLRTHAEQARKRQEEDRAARKEGDDVEWSAAVPDEKHPADPENDDDDGDDEPVRTDSYYENTLIAAARVACSSDFRTIVDEMGLEVHDWGFRLQDIDMKPGTLVLWHNKATDWPWEPARKAHELLRGSELVLTEKKNLTDAETRANLDTVLDTMLDRMGCTLVKT